MRLTVLSTSPPARQPRAGQLSEAREHRKTRQKPERPRPGGPARSGRARVSGALFRLRLGAVSPRVRSGFWRNDYEEIIFRFCGARSRRRRSRCVGRARARAVEAGNQGRRDGARADAARPRGAHTGRPRAARRRRASRDGRVHTLFAGGLARDGRIHQLRLFAGAPAVHQRPRGGRPRPAHPRRLDLGFALQPLRRAARRHPHVPGGRPEPQRRAPRLRRAGHLARLRLLVRR